MAGDDGSAEGVSGEGADFPGYSDDAADRRESRPKVKSKTPKKPKPNKYVLPCIVDTIRSIAIIFHLAFSEHYYNLPKRSANVTTVEVMLIWT